MRQALILIFLGVVITACGFRPVHSADIRGVRANSITIAEIPGRAGHMLRQNLDQELATGLPGVESGLLRIELSERLRRIPIRVDGSAARSDLIASARYVLDTGDDAISGVVTSETSFSVPIAQFGDISAQTSASDRAMILLAQRVAADLRLQLVNTP